MNSIDIVSAILHCLREGPKNVNEVRSAVGCDWHAAKRWLDGLEQRGVVTIARGKRKANVGKWPMCYALRAEFGGRR